MLEEPGIPEGKGREAILSRLVHPQSCKDKGDNGVSWNPHGPCYEGAGVHLISQLLSEPPPLLLCRKPKACAPADSAGALEPGLADAVGIVAETSGAHGCLFQLLHLP